MGFGSFLGNDSIKSRLSASAQSGKLSHSYLICGPEGSGKHTLARLLAAAMQCTSGGEKPCLSCPQCRKVLDGTHPDVIVVDEAEKKTVSVDLARWAKTDLYIRPNEGKKKVYLFPRAQDLTPAAQNSLLKVVEEPPEYGAFILLSTGAERILGTIRSRSVELPLSPVPKAEAAAWLQQQFPKKDGAEILSAWQAAGGFLGGARKLLQAGETLDERVVSLCEAFATNDRLQLAAILSKMEKMKREQMLPILRQIQGVVAQSLTAKAGRPVPETAGKLAAGKTAERLLRAYEDLREAIEAAEANVGVGHICGLLAVRLR